MGYDLNGSIDSTPAFDHAGLLDQVRNLQAMVHELVNVATAADLSINRSSPAAVEVRIQRILKLRRSRQEIFGDPLFGEPAWDMLLELYSANLQGRQESVSSLCIASGVPSTTALRWINTLEEEEWIERQADPSDGRRSFLSLTPKGLAAMDRFFAQPEIVQGL